MHIRGRGFHYTIVRRVRPVTTKWVGALYFGIDVWRTRRHRAGRPREFGLEHNLARGDGRVLWAMARLTMLCYRAASSDTGTAQLIAHPHEFSERSCLHLLHHMTAVNLDGDLAQAEFRGNLLVEKAPRDQCHDFALACRQRLESSVKRFERSLFDASLPSSSSCSRTGFIRNSTAPDFIA
jgi:hypothetical protein